MLEIWLVFCSLSVRKHVTKAFISASSVNNILSHCHLNLSEDSFIYIDFQEFRFVFRKLLEINMEVPESLPCWL